MKSAVRPLSFGNLTIHNVRLLAIAFFLVVFEATLVDVNNHGALNLSQLTLAMFLSICELARVGVTVRPLELTISMTLTSHEVS